MLEYWVWYSSIKEMPLREKLALLEHFTDPEELFHSDHPAAKLGDMAEAEDIVRKCRREGIDIITFRDTAYPKPLRAIADAPMMLYCKGAVPLFEKHPVIGVVGTRKATPYGVQSAATLSAQIAQHGGIVVSGGAAGIDSAALKGAVGAAGIAVAVLGCGVDVVYPRTNRRLFMDVEACGCLISEYPPGTPPLAWNFPRRNRIISGLSDGVLVVEAPEKSGAMITARAAIDQNRDVFVVPGNIDVITCEGSNRLLQEGAYPVFSGWDVVKNYASVYPDTVVEKLGEKKAKALKVAQKPVLPDKISIDKEAPRTYSVFVEKPQEMTEEEKRLFDCLDRRARPIDEVAALADQPVGNALSVLTKMAMRGIILMHPGKLFSRK